MNENAEQGDLGAIPQKPKKISVAMDNIESKIKQTQMEIELASKKLTVLQEIYRDLERIKVDKYTE
jgi:hypothetical protein